MTKPSEKLRVALIFGGRSGEHEVSLRSARSVFEALDRERFDIDLIGIDQRGSWHLLDAGTFRELTDRQLAAVADGVSEVTILPEPNQGRLVPAREPGTSGRRIDVVFPVLHGTLGEDGTVQGFLELADLPYVGAGVLGSAIGMDKDVQKRLLMAADIPIVPFVSTTRFAWRERSQEIRDRVAALGLPLFVKPANLGSSVGITKVKSLEALADAVETALAYDTKVIIETGIDAREIECAVLGNDDPIVSIPGEICPRGEFYSYDAKYIDDEGAALLIPAPLEAEQTTQIRALARQVYQALECAGMARVDCFLERGSGRIYVNEVNTIPGFTSISMYPKLWEASGIPYRELITRLIELALERHAERGALRRSYLPSAASNPVAARSPSK